MTYSLIRALAPAAGARDNRSPPLDRLLLGVRIAEIIADEVPMVKVRRQCRLFSVVPSSAGTTAE